MSIYKLSKLLIYGCMMDIRKFLDVVGRDEIITRFGFRAQDLSRAVKDGVFPSGWYPFIRELCDERRLEVPDHLFRWSTVPKRIKSAGLRGAA